ncbi:MAG: glycoside hydrolase family 43 protein [Bacteroidaceae bacterium]|jgi:beta-xylosidase
MKFKKLLALFATCVLTLSAYAQTDSIKPLAKWLDTSGNPINAHGGGILYHEGRYYWYGEHRPEKGFSTQVGVTCYSSDDLVHWKYESVALPVSEEAGSDIERGCIMERPKVIYNPKTKKFVLWFHLELKGKGYAAARAGVATADTPQGPFEYLGSFRLNPGKYPRDWGEKEKAQAQTFTPEDYKMEWWTDAWRAKITDGMLFMRDLEGGQMSRDQTLFVDTDGKAYQITSSEENLTLLISQLNDEFTAPNGQFIRVAPGGQNEAPTIFKHNGTYWMITSGCTGWAPNSARMFSAPSIWGPWTQHPNPCIGEGGDKTFSGQSTYILPLPEYGEDAFLFMADQWRPQSLADSRYLWLPIRFDSEGKPQLRFEKSWTLESLR